MKICILLVLLLQFISTGTLYPMSGTVTALEPETNSVIMTSSNGHIWAFEGIEDWDTGDGVTAIMFDPDTPQDCTDDMIVSVQSTLYVNLITNSSTAGR